MIKPPIRPSRKDLFARLDALGLAHNTYDHEAIFTVEQGAHLKAQWPGGHSKNLFLKDKKGALVLISALGETAVLLKGLHREIGSDAGIGRLSFGSPELMEEVLGVTPGSVTIFALISENAHRLSQVILDKALLDHDPVHFHPLENTATTAIAPHDLLTFVRDCGFEPKIMDFATLADGAAQLPRP